MQFTECDVRRNGTAVSSVQMQTARYVSVCLSDYWVHTPRQFLAKCCSPCTFSLIETEHCAPLSAVVSASNVTIFDLITLVAFCAIWRSLLLTVAYETAADCLSMYCCRLMRVVMTLTLSGVPYLRANQLQKTCRS